MKTNGDAFVRTCLGAIVLLLALIAIRPVISVPPARADSRPQYKIEVVDEGPGGKAEAIIDKLIQQRGQEGWNLVAATVYNRELLPGQGGTMIGPKYLLVFRK